MNDWMGLGIGLLGGLLIGAGGAWGMAQRRLREAEQRIAHVEQGRQQELHNTSAARRQVEVLQKELGEMRHLMARRGEKPPARQAAVLEVMDDAGQFAPAPAASHAAEAFAPTQLIPRPPRS